MTMTIPDNHTTQVYSRQNHSVHFLFMYILVSVTGERLPEGAYESDGDLGTGD